MREFLGNPFIFLDNVAYEFSDGIKINIDHAEIKQGDRILISGPSGCGKSTVLGMLSLSLKPTKGRNFYFEQNDILKLWNNYRRDQLAHLRSAYFGFVPQTAGLIPFITIKENITLPLSIIGKKNKVWFDQLITYLEIGPILSKKPCQVSVGQRQRVAVARALINRPMIVLADEPTASVHPTLADEILHLLVETVTEAGSVLIMTSHDVKRALQYGLKEMACNIDNKTKITRLRIHA
ncbi:MULTISPECIES: ABC transporter ATP-binding protein [unclassified Commensalibacter]|uniref:ABC transporter ATP-binding protein n=1 Tax=unclassified Commensalibacter TaxID=2630218 RepID=UPI0018DCB5AF|nr:MULTISPECIES: ATP-binding cassette domain-containing protein [unclassified Commensalibacter]MBH9969559.1 ATP-binding cassette domain-containing protein [Commensalibacter sp. M0265]MBH9976914.1 ATP-binding cassette domain-containing protein [Commensalibacter sp. M0266]MBH9992149.1 ATP-binding cassette domain-containing protein [Commensalibacter sp. M0270]MBI0046090.1 ATP-binding cassette domain-containing protein [Commensalibacter sp. M0267]MBI0055759.1 ATP-binding cassette domain-containing